MIHIFEAISLILCTAAIVLPIPAFRRDVSFERALLRSVFSLGVGMVVVFMQLRYALHLVQTNNLITLRQTAAQIEMRTAVFAAVALLLNALLLWKKRRASGGQARQ